MESVVWHNCHVTRHKIKRTTSAAKLLREPHKPVKEPDDNTVYGINHFLTYTMLLGGGEIAPQRQDSSYAPRKITENKLCM